MRSPAGRGLRIAVVAAMPFPSPQGTQVVVAASTRALVRAGHQVTLLTYGHGAGEPPPDLPLRRLPVLPGYRRLRAGPDVVKPALDLLLVRRLAAIGADVVLAHHVEGAAAAWLAGRRTGVPVVWMHHTLLAEELGTYLPGVGERRLGRGLDQLGGALDGALARRVAAVITLSDRAARVLAAAGAPRVRALLPGVEPDDFVGLAPVAHPRPTVVYTGNPDPYQDLPLLAEAARRLPGLRLLLVGHHAFPGRWPPNVERRWVPDWPAARDLLAGAAAAVVPRARCGGVPVKLLNALWLGVPTVVSAESATGLPGEVRVPPGDGMALAGGIREALRMGRFEPAEVRRRLDWGRVAGELGHILQDTSVSVSG